MPTIFPSTTSFSQPGTRGRGRFGEHPKEPGVRPASGCAPISPAQTPSLRCLIVLGFWGIFGDLGGFWGCARCIGVGSPLPVLPLSNPVQPPLVLGLGHWDSPPPPMQHRSCPSAWRDPKKTETKGKREKTIRIGGMGKGGGLWCDSTCPSGNGICFFFNSFFFFSISFLAFLP